MPASPFDSELYRGLLQETDCAKLFSDSAEVRAMLLVEGALAKVQGEIGMIPPDSAAAIHRASFEIQIDPGALSAQTAVSGVPVPAFVAAFRQAMQAPEHAQYIHWGATSQDIMDTALVLRLRQVMVLQEARLKEISRALAGLAVDHAQTPMCARTWGQSATVTSFGAVVAAWGSPLLRHLDRLNELRPRLLNISLAGAAGTLSAMGKDGPDLRGALAKALGLGDNGASWHSTRDNVAEYAGWATLVAGSLAKIGEDLLLLAHSGLDEVALDAGGGSSTMPQKSNPVHPSLLVALARQVTALNGAMHSALPHREQRDGAAWMVEWMSLPQMAIATSRALVVAEGLARGITPQTERMRASLEDDGGLVFAEPLVFALAARIPRPEAQAAVKDLCRDVRTSGQSLPARARARWPEIDLAAVFNVTAQMGIAPQEARKFADLTANL